MDRYVELMQRLLEIQSGARERSPELMSCKVGPSLGHNRQSDLFQQQFCETTALAQP